MAEIITLAKRRQPLRVVPEPDHRHDPAPKLPVFFFDKPEDGKPPPHLGVLDEALQFLAAGGRIRIGELQDDRLLPRKSK